MARRIVLAAAVLVACTSPDTIVPVTARTAVGYDAYLRWDRWPVLRVGTRTEMRSTFDRAGANDGSDASHFLRRDGDYVPLEIAGPGVLTFSRANHWHGSPWRYAVDGRDTIVSETSTATPDAPVTPSTFLPAGAFPAPLAVTWSVTNGADLSWVRVPFGRHFELGYGRSHYGTGYWILQRFAEGTAEASEAARGWDASVAPPADVLRLFAAAGTDIAPPGLPRRAGVVTAGARVPIVDLDGPATLRTLRFTVPRDRALAFGRARLRITWDDRATPSVDAPVALFFGTGTLYRRDDREWIVKSVPSSVRYPPGASTVELASYFPMPFASRALVELESSEPIDGVAWEVAIEPHLPDAAWGLFHATSRDHTTPVAGQDLVLVDTRGEEGADAWCGTFVGTSFVFSDRAVLDTLEGDPRFFFDDSSTPQAQGTGTEEWGGGGDYWGGRTTTLPFAGHPSGAPDPKSVREPEDAIESAYRFLLGDAMPFGFRARIQLEHGGEDLSLEHYRTVAFWYGAPNACLVLADEIAIGDPGSEAVHAYAARDADPAVDVTSAYEVGPVASQETHLVRKLRGGSEMIVTVPEDNAGLLLRRRLDLDVADQRAEVWVGDADDPAAPMSHAGTWLTAGSTRVVYANAASETGDDPGTIQVSPRRFRDDELLVGSQLTRGHRRLRIRVDVTSAPHPPRPGDPVPEAAFTESHWWIYAWRAPK